MKRGRHPNQTLQKNECMFAKDPFLTVQYVVILVNLVSLVILVGQRGSQWKAQIYLPELLLFTTLEIPSSVILFGSPKCFFYHEETGVNAEVTARALKLQSQWLPH